MLPLLRSCLAVVVLSITLASPIRASAQQPEDVSLRIRRARPATVTAAFVASAASFALGAGLAYLLLESCDSGGDSGDGSALNCLSAPSAIGLVATGGVVVAPALAARLVGKERDVGGNLGLSIMGAGIGTLVGGATSIAWVASTDLELGPGVAIVGAAMSTLATTGAVLGYNASARGRARRAARTLQPSVGPTSDRRGLMIAVGTTF